MPRRPRCGSRGLFLRPAKTAAIESKRSTVPAPSEDGHVEAVVQVVLEGALALGGRTLVLAASLKNLRRITEQLRTQLGSQPALQVLCQGEAARHALLAQFSSAQHSATGAILVASAAFRAGVDIPGAALQLVVLDKLPFPMPDDPLVQARERQIKASARAPNQSPGRQSVHAVPSARSLGHATPECRPSYSTHQRPGPAVYLRSAFDSARLWQAPVGQSAPHAALKRSSGLAGGARRAGPRQLVC